MADVVGGLRARLIRQSVYEMVNQALDDLGWFDPTRPHKPVRFESDAQNQEQQILENTAALSDENMSDDEVEMGSQLAEHRWVMYIDMFADSDALGLHFIRDVKDILQGKMSAIGRARPTVEVYDYRQATPPEIFTCQIERVVVERSHGFLKPWLEHWYSCSFEIVDTYDRDF